MWPFVDFSYEFYNYYSKPISFNPRLSHGICLRKNKVLERYVEKKKCMFDFSLAEPRDT